MRKKAFRCRNIYTAVTDELIDGYVVTDGNKIIFVGSQEDSKEYIDSNTEVFDVSNNFIMPGSVSYTHLDVYKRQEYSNVGKYDCGRSGDKETC